MSKKDKDEDDVVLIDIPLPPPGVPNRNGDVFIHDLGPMLRAEVHHGNRMSMPVIGLLGSRDRDPVIGPALDLIASFPLPSWAEADKVQALARLDRESGVRREPAAPVSYSMGCMVPHPICPQCKKEVK
jgi:hypothetical protein